MQCLTLKENFILTCLVRYRPDRKNPEITDNIESILLIKIKAIYIFDIKKGDQNKKEDFIEDKLLLKALHNQVYIEKFTNEINEVKYASTNEENSDLNFVIKLETPLAKEYIKILALFEAWKLAEKMSKDSKEPFNLKDVGNTDIDMDEEAKNRRRNTKNYNMIDSCPNIIYLFQIIDSFIQHDYVFQIDYLIIQLNKDYPYFLKNFFFVITIFNKIKIDLLLDEQIADVFPIILPQDTESFKDNFNSFNIKYSLIHLSLKSSNLKDSFAERILPYFILKSPFLQVLDLSNNLLTNEIFQVLLIKEYINVNLKTLNLSKNQLTSDNLSKYIFQISKEFLCITLFDLRGNKIDNRFLNNFNPKAYEELRNIIQDKLSGNNPNNNYSNEIVIFDLRDTNINIEKTSYRLYMKKKKDLSTHLEIKNNFNDNYEAKFFGLENINFIFDVYFFNRSNYKYSGCSKSKSRLNVEVKDYQLRIPSNIKEKKIVYNEINNNWFKTGYYEKEDENQEKGEEMSNKHTDKKKRNAIAQIKENDIKIKQSSDEETSKVKSSFYQSSSKISSSKTESDNQSSSKKTSTFGYNSRSSVSKYTREIDSKLYDGSKTIIEEENSESNSSSESSEESEKKSSSKEEENLYSSVKSSSNNKKSKGSSSGFKSNNKKDKVSKMSSTFNNKKYNSSNKEEESEEDETTKNNNIINNNEKNNMNNTNTNSNNIINGASNSDNNENNNNAISKINEENNEEQKVEEKSSNNKGNGNINDTIIIEKTDDESSEEEKKASINNKRNESLIPLKTRAQKELGSRSNTKNFLHSKSTLFDKNVDYNKINQYKKQYELDLYRELFRYFFLLDYYFDPILNSFATEMPPGVKREKKYMSIKNEEKRYEAIRNSINLINNKKKIKSINIKKMII